MQTTLLPPPPPPPSPNPNIPTHLLQQFPPHSSQSPRPLAPLTSHKAPPSIVKECSPLLQSSSYGESISTLGFGSRVSEITLGQAKKNSESAQIFEAKDQMIRCVCLSVLGHMMQILDSSSCNDHMNTRSAMTLCNSPSWRYPSCKHCMAQLECTHIQQSWAVHL